MTPKQLARLPMARLRKPFWLVSNTGDAEPEIYKVGLATINPKQEQCCFVELEGHSSQTNVETLCLTLQEAKELRNKLMRELPTRLRSTAASLREQAVLFDDAATLVERKIKKNKWQETHQ